LRFPESCCVGNDLLMRLLFLHSKWLLVSVSLFRRSTDREGQRRGDQSAACGHVRRPISSRARAAVGQSRRQGPVRVCRPGRPRHGCGGVARPAGRALPRRPPGPRHVRAQTAAAPRGGSGTDPAAGRRGLPRRSPPSPTPRRSVVASARGTSSGIAAARPRGVRGSGPRGTRAHVPTVAARTAAGSEKGAGAAHGTGAGARSVSTDQRRGPTGRPCRHACVPAVCMEVEPSCRLPCAWLRAEDR
jgi:hypothetical protein